MPKCVQDATKRPSFSSTSNCVPREPARSLAQTYACLGDEEHALDYLEQSLAEDQPGVAEILQAPELAFMRPNARFAVLRQKLNLAP